MSPISSGTCSRTAGTSSNLRIGAFKSASHQTLEHRPALHRLGELVDLAFEPARFLEAGKFWNDSAVRVAEPVAVLDGMAPERDSGGNLLPPHRHPMLAHVHRRQRVRLVGFLRDEAIPTAAGAIRVEQIEPSFDERRLDVP